MIIRGLVAAGISLALFGALTACGDDGPARLSAFGNPDFARCSAAVPRPPGTPETWSAATRDSYLLRPAVLDCVVVLPPADREPLLTAALGAKSFDQAEPVLTAYVQAKRSWSGDAAAADGVARVLAAGVGRLLHYVRVSGSGGRTAANVATLQNELLAVRIYQRAFGPLPGYPAWVAQHQATHGADPANYYYDEVVRAGTNRPEFARAYEMVEWLTDSIREARHDEDQGVTS